MKVALTFLILCGIGKAYAQSRLFSFEGLTRKDTALVYKGVDNRVLIKNYQAGKTYQVTARQGTVWQVDNTGRFMYGRFGFQTQHDTLSLFVDGKWLGDEAVSVARIPDPQIRLGGSPPGKLNKAWVLSAPYLAVVFPDCYFKAAKARILGYTLVLAGAGVFDFEVSGEKLPQEVVERIKIHSGRFWLDFEARVLVMDACWARYMQFSYELF